MKVYIVNNKKISKYVLPLQLEEFFSVDYQLDNTNEKFSVTFTSNEVSKKWCLKSNGTVNVVDKEAIVDEIELDNYCCYQIKLLGISDVILVFAMPNQENELYGLEYDETKPIIIGNNAKCNICYKNPLIIENQAIIEFKNNVWAIREGINLKTGIYVNDRRISYSKLKYGDVIFINGLKIIWMPKHLKINNPNRQIYVSGMQAYNHKVIANNANVTAVSDEEAAIELYKEDDYFYHIPRIKETIEDEEITIDPPPECQLQEDVPFLLSMGSSLTLVVSSFVTGLSVYNGFRQGKDALELLPQILMVVAMIIGSLVVPKLLKSYQKRKAKKREALRQTKYKEYLAKKQEEINRILKHEKDILIQNNDLSIKCIETVKNNSRNLWAREIPDDDFLTISVGNGNVPTSLHISAPQEHFTLDKDNLFESVYEVLNNSKLLKNVPITFSFSENSISSFIFNCSYKDNYINDIMTKLLTFHSESDLKIVILTSTNEEKPATNNSLRFDENGNVVADGAENKKEPSGIEFDENGFVISFNEDKPKLGDSLKFDENGKVISDETEQTESEFDESITNIKFDEKGYVILDEKNIKSNQDEIITIDDEF